tara:strand:- start:2295 stop:3050 length:756 start_codon:yes stop_codon:yes gene_type:complete
MNNEWIMDDACFNDINKSNIPEYNLDSLVAEAEKWPRASLDNDIWTYDDGVITEPISSLPIHIGNNTDSAEETHDDTPDLELGNCDNFIVEGSACVLHEGHESNLSKFPNIEQLNDKYNFEETCDGYDIKSLLDLNYHDYLKSSDFGQIYLNDVFRYISLGGYISHELMVELNNRCAEEILKKYYPNTSIETAKREKLYPYNNIISKKSYNNPITGTYLNIHYYGYLIPDYSTLAKVCINFMIEYKEHILY